MRNWTSLRETYGEPAMCSHPIACVLAAQPDLRGLLPSELAQRLQISLDDAQQGILSLAADCFPDGTPRPTGESFDSLVLLAGAPVTAVSLEGEGPTLRTGPYVRTPF